MQTLLTLMTVILFVQAMATIAVFYLLFVNTQTVDIDRISGQISSRMIDAYSGELEVLSEIGVRKAARESYVEMCGAFGLPESATEKVSSDVWAAIAAAQGDPI